MCVCVCVLGRAGVRSLRLKNEKKMGGIVTTFISKNKPELFFYLFFLKQLHNISNCSININLKIFMKQNINILEKTKNWTYFQRRKTLFSILFYPITLQGRRGTTDEFATIPFHLDLFSAALVELAKSIPVHSLILSSHLFFCLPLFLFLFTVPCRIVFAKPEDLETWPNHLSFRFLTRVRSSSYSPMAAWIFLRTSSLVTWSLCEMFNSLQ